MARPGVLLDRDGVINMNRTDHVKSWDEFRFLPGVLTALRWLSRFEVPIAVITNQSIVNRMIISHAELAVIHAHMNATLRSNGVRVDGIFYCPHDSSERCGCRKPKPGLLLEAAAALDLDLQHSVFVGDASSDVSAGQRVGCRTILVRSGRWSEAEQALIQGHVAPPDHTARDLLAAIPFIQRIVGSPTQALHPFSTVVDSGGQQHEQAALAVAATN